MAGALFGSLYRWNISTATLVCKVQRWPQSWTPRGLIASLKGRLHEWKMRDLGDFPPSCSPSPWPTHIACAGAALKVHSHGFLPLRAL